MNCRDKGEAAHLPVSLLSVRCSEVRPDRPQAADRLPVTVLFVRDRWCRWEVAGCRAVAMAAMLQGTENDRVRVALTSAGGASACASHPQAARSHSGCRMRSGQAAGRLQPQPQSTVAEELNSTSQPLPLPPTHSPVMEFPDRSTRCSPGNCTSWAVGAGHVSPAEGQPAHLSCPPLHHTVYRCSCRVQRVQVCTPQPRCSASAQVIISPAVCWVAGMRPGRCGSRAWNACCWRGRGKR